MTVAVGGLAALAAQQLIDRHPGLAALDVPQRLIHAADGVVQHRAVPPVGAVVARLPGIVDPVGGLADQERLQILFDRRHHQVGALREGAAAIAVKSVLIGRILTTTRRKPAGAVAITLYVFDLRRRRPAGRRESAYPVLPGFAL